MRLVKVLPRFGNSQSSYQPKKILYMSPDAIKVKVKIIDENGSIPLRMTPGSAGFDVFSCENAVIPASSVCNKRKVSIGRALVRSGIILEIPKGIVGRIGSRSGLSIKNNIEIGAGWIDNDYRGELKIEVKNLSEKPFKIQVGDRIAQIFFLALSDVVIKKVAHVSKTSRGNRGFGSTNQMRNP